VDGASRAFQALHAGKRSVLLDLKTKQGRSEAARLARECRVVVESFRPGVAARLGVDYETIRAVRPDVVYCSLTGYGQTGPYRDDPGHDLNFAAMTGLLSVGPLPGITVADLAGGMTAALGILGALVSGRGAYLDISLSEALLSWMQLPMAHTLESGEELDARSNPISGIFACYRVYEARDGKRIAVAALERKFWKELCRRCGKPELVGVQYDPGEQPRLIGEWERVFSQATREEWTGRLKGLPVTPVLSLSEAAAHPLFRGRGAIETYFSQGGRALERVAIPIRDWARVELTPRKSPGVGQR